MSKILEIICFCWHKKGCKDCDLNNHPIYGMCGPKIEEEKIRELMLSEEDIAKKLHSFNAITSDEKMLNRLWDEILDKDRKEYYRKLAKSIHKEYERKLFGG